MGLFSVNNQEMARLVSYYAYKPLVQDIVLKNKFGCTEEFITQEQMNASMVDILVTMPLGGRLRMYGGLVNGKWINDKNQLGADGQRLHAKTKRYTIDILKRYDINISITEDEVLAYEGLSFKQKFRPLVEELIEQDIALNINAYTNATILYQFIIDSFSTTPTAGELKLAGELYVGDTTGGATIASTNNALRRFQRANAKVSKGNRALFHGFTPAKNRQAILQDFMYKVDLALPATNMASDIAAMMVGRGGVNPLSEDKSQKTVEDFESGWVGHVDGVPLYIVGQDILDLTCEYMGVTDPDVAELIGQIAAFICPANVTIRAIKATDFKVVDDTLTQGVIIQPKINLGCRCLSGNSIKAVFSGDGFVDETTALASIKKIRDHIIGKLVLPNMSYDVDPYIMADSVLRTKADGTQTVATTRLANAGIDLEGIDLDADNVADDDDIFALEQPKETKKETTKNTKK